MKRTLLAGSFYALAGVATLLLAASIFYSCRSGGDPHHEQTTHDTPAEETHASRASEITPQGTHLTLTGTHSSSENTPA